LNCRIKYNKLKSGELESGELTSIKGTVYFARIDFIRGCWKILNAKRRNVIKEGYSQNKNVLRRMVRRELQKLGVKLEKEFKESGYSKTKSRKLL
jgi:hypothetical protein